MNTQNDALLNKYKEQYFGKTYQWVRPINNETPGECVRVVDVKMRGNLVLLVFNAGSPVNVELLGQYLQPVGNEGGMPPGALSQANNIASPTGGGPIEIPAELKDFTTEKAKISFTAQPEQTQQSAPVVKKKSDIFAMFQSEEKNINLPLTIKMPDLALVKMMYNNAADKDKFLTELAEYVIDGISVETAKSAISALLDPDGDVKISNSDDKQDTSN